MEFLERPRGVIKFDDVCIQLLVASLVMIVIVITGFSFFFLCFDLPVDEVFLIDSMSVYASLPLIHWIG